MSGKIKRAIRLYCMVLGWDNKCICLLFVHFCLRHTEKGCMDRTLFGSLWGGTTTNGGSVMTSVSRRQDVRPRKSRAQLRAISRRGFST